MHFLFPWLGYLSPAASNCTHPAERAIKSEDWQLRKMPTASQRSCEIFGRNRSGKPDGKSVIQQLRFQGPCGSLVGAAGFDADAHDECCEQAFRIRSMSALVILRQQPATPDTPFSIPLRPEYIIASFDLAPG
jgi:hypothetical protein